MTERDPSPLPSPARPRAPRAAAPELILSNAEARHVFLTRHRLAAPPTGPADPATVSDTIRQIGFVQVDSVSTVARAHHMILYARHHRYRPGTLTRLLDQRLLFEGWTHDASLIPMAFWPYWRRRFRTAEAALRERWGDRHGRDLSQCDEVLARIRDNGPTLSRDFEEEKSSAGWWNWQPSKVALEFLWRTGQLSVCHREAFQKVYDLTERVVPPDIHAHEVSDEEIVDWAAEAALERLGFATPRQLADFFELITTAEAEGWLSRNAGRLRRIGITLADGTVRPAYAFADGAPLETAGPTARLRVVSPFDPMVRDRRRTETLFDFHYRIEIYVPKPKRRYGYYVFPILEGDRFVGRIDMTRGNSGALEVTGVWPEPGVRFGAARARALEAELTRLARFAGCEGVVFLDGWLRD